MYGSRLMKEEASLSINNKTSFFCRTKLSKIKYHFTYSVTSNINIREIKNRKDEYCHRINQRAIQIPDLVGT